MSRQLGDNDFYSIYDFQDQTVIDFFDEQRTKKYNNWEVFSVFYVHPDGPKVSDDWWAVNTREFAHEGWYRWATVKTMNSAFFDDSIKFYAYFYFSNWKYLKVFTEIDVQYRRCVAKAFVERWSEKYGNLIAFLRTEFREFVDYIDRSFDYEGKKWIDEQKSSILSELLDIPSEIKLTDPSVVYFPDKNDEIKAAYTCYRTYDGWFGYVFKPYCENPIKKEGDTWMYHDGHGYVPVEYVSKYVESVPNKIDVAQATEHYISELNLVNQNSIESFKDKCLDLVEFYKFRELLMEITQVDHENDSYYSYHCDRYLNTELKKIMDWLDAIYECFSRIISYVDNIQDSELKNNFFDTFSWIYLVIGQFYPGIMEFLHSLFYNEEEGWYPGYQGEEYASYRYVHWLELLGIFYGTDEADTFIVPIRNYFVKGLKYMKVPTTPSDLVLHAQAGQDLQEITVDSHTYGFNVSGTYYWVQDQTANYTQLALIIRWYVRNYSMNGIPVIGNLLAETATEAAQIGQNVKPIFFLKADWDVLKPWLGDKYTSNPTNMLELFQTWSIQLDSDIYVDQNIDALYDFYRKMDVARDLRRLCTVNYTSYQVRSDEKSMPDYVLKTRSANSNDLLIFIGGTREEITEPQILDFSKFVDLVGFNPDSYISEINDKKFCINNNEWLYKMLAFLVNGFLLPILEVSTEGLLASVPDMPEVATMTRESYENWLRECQLIDLTLAKTLKLYVDRCVREVTSFTVDDNRYSVYGCECYTAQAISNIIAIAQQLVKNEQDMKWFFGNALDSNLQEKYEDWYGTPSVSEDFYFRRVSFSRLISDQGVIRYNTQYTNMITAIATNIPNILDEDIYYQDIPSSLVNSSERELFWEPLESVLITLIEEMIATPVYITDIRQYEKYSSLLNWIQKFKLFGENSDTIAISHNQLEADTLSGVESITEAYEINQN